MISERQRIEAPPTTRVENNMPPPPAYEEVNGVYASHRTNGTTDKSNFFLGEVSQTAGLFLCFSQTANLFLCQLHKITHLLCFLFIAIIL